MFQTPSANWFVVRWHFFFHPLRFSYFSNSTAFWFVGVSQCLAEVGEVRKYKYSVQVLLHFAWIFIFRTTFYLDIGKTWRHALDHIFAKNLKKEKWWNTVCIYFINKYTVCVHRCVMWGNDCRHHPPPSPPVWSLLMWSCCRFFPGASSFRLNQQPNKRRTR